ncbi:hypothetical protein MHLP_01455 [Candidatus Mycoplasma haematolamae str. Purdue]|uniref:Uncharacterized protein n=1 Tax=Mycoplasma haematolamae (strain Purdue) TaxID=1212765 RepID=I7CF37_MYCHA|nr:hypothetical protein MHLP_01455 [Candidatus Mycoplasma haematolamae str. Purdue]
MREELRRYFSEFGGSIQNKSHSAALDYLDKTESLRGLVAQYLGIEETHLVSFQPNSYYLEEIVFENLNLDESWTVITDDPLREEFKKAHSVRSLEDLGGLDKSSKLLLWVSQSFRLSLNQIRGIERLLKGNKDVVSYFSVDKGLLEAHQFRSLWTKASFVSLNPAEGLKEFGTVFLCFSKTINLKPVMLGSHASSFGLGSKEIEVKELPYSLEIGTQNVISLLYLEKVFSSLVNS